MKIWNHLTSDMIFLDIPLPDKDAVIRFIANAFAETGNIKHSESLCLSFMEREKLMSTGIGGGIGIPHAFSSEAESARILLMRLQKPVDFNALDSKPVGIIAAILAPENRTEMHLQILAGIARLFRNPTFMNLFRTCSDSDQLLKGIFTIEEEIF